MNSKLNTFVLIIFLLLSACSTDGAHKNAQNSGFSIALIGDLPYSASKEIEAQNLMEDLSSHEELAFIIHDGDFKSGNTPCTNELYEDRLNSFQQSKQPLFYIFGDNEWVDCHRLSAGGYSPFERLAVLRNKFAAIEKPFSFGRHRLPLERQNAAFPENIRWSKNHIFFVGLHVVGSNNGLKTAERFQRQANEEFRLRNAANLEYLRDTFQLASQQNSPAIMVIIQANPWDFIPAENLTGIEDFVVLLENLTKAFGKPVVLVHGDSHYFRIDKPLPCKHPSQVKDTALPYVMPFESGKPRLANFTRVETFGNPNSHWVRATIDLTNPNIFTFEAMLVKKNISAN